MRPRALNMSTAAWLLVAAVLMAGTLGRTIRRPHSSEHVTWRTTQPAIVIDGTPRAAHRAAVAPPPSRGRHSRVADPAEERKAAAMLLLLMLGGGRPAAIPR